MVVPLQVTTAEPLKLCDTHRKLYWTLKLKDIQAKQGTAVKLTCSVTGFDPVFRWFKDARPIENWNRNCLNMTKGVIGVIRLSDLTPQDAGEYKCVVQNDQGTIETRCNLEILPNPDKPLVRPRFAMITDFYVYQFDELVLDTRIDSAEEPQLTFLRNGETLSLDKGKFSLAVEEPDHYRLVISHPDQGDSGIYAVIAKNSAGEDRTSHRIDFKGRDYHRLETPVQKLPHRKRPQNPENERQDPQFEQLRQRWQKVKKTLTPPLIGRLPRYDDAEEKPVKEITEGEEGEEEHPEPVKKLSRAEKARQEREIMRHHLKFEAHLKDQVMLEGSTVKFVCTVVGPEPTFKWLKDGEPLAFTKTCKNNTKLGVGSVVINDVGPRDSGVYKCEVSNKFCSAESEAKLTVLPRKPFGSVEPTFTRAIKEYYNVSTDDIILEVRTRGVPDPKVTWLKDCLECDNPEYFPEGKYFCMREPNGVFKLAIHDPKRGDSGRYTCIAANVAGKIELDHYVTVLPKTEYTHVHGIIYADPKEQVSKQLKKVYEGTEERVANTLELVKHNKEETILHQTELVQELEKAEAVRLAAEKEWMEKERVRIEKEKEIKAAEERERIKNIQESGEDVPTPDSEIPEPIETVDEAPVEKKPPVPEDPKFALGIITSLRNLCVLEGCQARLVCSVDGYRPEFKWLKNGEPLEQTATIKNLSKDTIGCLSIQNIHPTDEGTYTCLVSNRYCEISTSCKVEIIRKPEEKGEPPMFKKVRHYYDQQTDQLILEIQISGQPFLEMLWYKDCRDIKNDDKYLIAREPGGIYKLYVYKPVRRDCGTYMVQVENQYGVETLKHDIEFWDKSDFVHANRTLHADPKNKWKKLELVKVDHPVFEKDEDEAAVVLDEGSERSRRYRPFEMPPEPSRAERRKQLYKLEFITLPRNYTVAKGSTIKLTCCTSDAKKLTVTWTKNGEPLEKGDHITETVTKEGFCSLELKHVTLDDNGIYECHARTELGEASCSAKVQVYEIEPVTAVDTAPVLATALLGKLLSVFAPFYQLKQCFSNFVQTFRDRNDFENEIISMSKWFRERNYFRFENQVYLLKSFEKDC